MKKTITLLFIIQVLVALSTGVYARTGQPIQFSFSKFGSYIGKSDTKFIHDMASACIDPSANNKQYAVNFYDEEYTLSYHLDEDNLIDRMSLIPVNQNDMLNKWKNLLEKSKTDKSWGNFLGCKFSGTQSGLKQTIDETIKLAESSNMNNERISPIFNPMDGVYFSPEIDKNLYRFSLLRSYFKLNPSNLASQIDGSFEDLYQANYFISNKINAWGLYYIYFAYVRDDENRIFNMNVNADKSKEKILEISAYLNDTDNKNNTVAEEVWMHHAKLLTKKYSKYSLYSTDKFGQKLSQFNSLEEAISFIKSDNRQNGIILSIPNGSSQINLIINKNNTYFLIKKSPANATISFAPSDDRSISIEVHSKDSIYVDWGDGIKQKTKSGLITGTLKGENIKLYGEITSIDCSSSKVTAIELKDLNLLETLACSHNKIKKLDLSECINLEELDCDKNQLTELFLSSCPKLKTLLCSENQITKINLSSLTKLKRFGCSENKIKELDFSNNPLLNNLNCSSNQLTSLELKNNPKLTWLVISNNVLTKVDLSQCPNLVKIDLSKNQLDSLDLTSNSNLEYIVASDNRISEIKTQPMNQLMELILANNNLKTLDFNHFPNVMRLNIAGNQFTHISLKQNEKIRDLSVYDNPITPDGYSQIADQLYSRKDLTPDGHIFIVSNIKHYAPEIKENDLNTLKEKNWSLYRVVIENGQIQEFELTDAELTPYIYHQKSGSIKFTTQRKAGEYIGLKIKALGDYEISGAKKVATDTYKLESSDITISGDIIFMDCSSNQLTSLDVSKTKTLTTLLCDDNKLNKLVLSSSIDTLYCGNNDLSALDLSNLTSLKDLSLWGNHITTLDLSRNTRLKSLICRDNQIEGTLDLSQNPYIAQLNCNNNKIKRIDLAKNSKIQHLECLRNQIKGQDMTDLMNSLPQYVKFSPDEWDDYMGMNPQGLYLVDPTKAEENKASTKDVAIAKSKGWPVWIIDMDQMGVEKPKEYDGNPNSLILIPNKQSFAIVKQTNETIFLNKPAKRFEIYSISGEIILYGRDRIRIDISNISNGIYILRLNRKECIKLNIKHN